MSTRIGRGAAEARPDDPDGLTDTVDGLVTSVGRDSSASSRTPSGPTGAATTSSDDATATSGGDDARTGVTGR